MKKMKQNSKIAYEAPSLFPFPVESEGMLCDSYTNSLPDLTEEDAGLTWTGE